MICKVYRHWRIVRGKRVRDSLYTGHLRIDGDEKISYIPLKTKDKVVAEKKLEAICAEREREKIGILAPKVLRSAAELLLVEHLKAYVADLKVNDSAKGYVSCVEYRIKTLLRECGWLYLRDVNSDRFTSWRSVQTYAAKTLNDYLNAMGAFLNWLERMGRLTANPLKHVQRLETQGKEKRKRRSFAGEDLANLIAVSPKRAHIYLTAAYTGLRRKELSLLVWGDLFLVGDAPYVSVRASTSKNKRPAQIPLHPELVTLLASLKPAGACPTTKVFPKGIPRVPTLKRDLKAAGIDYKDALDRQVDFHALRQTLGTNLGKSGVSPWIGKDILRHSDVRLTTQTYTDASQMPTREAINKLPWITHTHIRTQISDSDGQKLSQTVIVKAGEESKKEVDSQRRNRSLSRVVTTWQKGRKAAALGLEPRTPRSRIWCATNCTTRHFWG
jgi:integrase